MVYEEHITEADMTYIEKSTIDQSNCLAWHQVRLGRIRASVAQDVLHTNQEKPSKSVILKICIASKIIKSPAMSWGKSNEKRALRAFADSMSDFHDGFTDEATELRLHKKYNFLGTWKL